MDSYTTNVPDKLILWTSIEDAIPIRARYGDIRYNAFLKAILKIASPLEILVETDNSGAWEYGKEKKEADLMALDDIKPYLRLCKLEFAVDNPKWQGKAIGNWLGKHPKDQKMAPELCAVEIETQYSRGHPTAAGQRSEWEDENGRRTED